MKKYLTMGLPLLALARGAQAQSSVTLYGIVDLGVDYANNVANAVNGQAVPGSGGRLFQMQSGVPLGSRWGLKGNEDLGGGIAVPLALTVIAASWFASFLKEHLVTPPAFGHSAVIALYGITTLSIVVTWLAPARPVVAMYQTPAAALPVSTPGEPTRVAGGGQSWLGADRCRYRRIGETCRPRELGHPSPRGPTACRPG